MIRRDPTPDATERSGTSALYGTLEALILKTLTSSVQLHGLEIGKRIQAQSENILHVEEGALYPALQRLRQRGLVEGEWRKSDKGRRARYYEITAEGREVLEREIRSWVRHTGAVNKVFGLGEVRAR